MLKCSWARYWTQIPGVCVCENVWEWLVSFWWAVGTFHGTVCHHCINVCKCDTLKDQKDAIQVQSIYHFQRLIKGTSHRSNTPDWLTTFVDPSHTWRRKLVSNLFVDKCKAIRKYTVIPNTDLTLECSGLKIQARLCCLQLWRVNL